MYSQQSAWTLCRSTTPPTIVKPRRAFCRSRRNAGSRVIVNQPFGGGSLLANLKHRPLPEFARDIGCTSWAQLLLKFVLSHPAVTCVTPGTGRREYMVDNVHAGIGDFPDVALRQRIAEAVA